MFPEVFATHTDISFHPDTEPLDTDFLSADLFTDSDLEFLESTFDLNKKKGLDQLIQMDEADFHRKVDEKEVSNCMEDLIKGVESMNEPKRLERTNSMELWTPGMPVPEALSEPIDMTVFDSESDAETESVAASEAEEESDAETESVAASDAEADAEADAESDAEAAEIHNLRQEVLDLEDSVQEQITAVEEREAELKRKEDELECMKHQHRLDMANMRKRMGKRSLDYCDSARPAKRYRVERRGCPFCPFEQTTSGYDMRCLKDHMTNGDCTCPIDDMTSRSCSHPNVWCEEGESGWQSLKNMGFKDPDNHVCEFRHFSCPKCDFTHWHARKFKRHLMAGLNRGGCAYSKEEAEQIKNEQLKRKNSVRI